MRKTPALYRRDPAQVDLARTRSTLRRILADARLTATVHWPVDPEVSVSAAVKGARRALDRAAAARTMRIVGEPVWGIDETDDGMHVLTMTGRAEYVPTWLDLAACAGNPDPFFTAEGARGPADTAEALRMCAQCLVSRQCAAAGAGEEHGVWGGRPKRERAELAS